VFSQADCWAYNAAFNQAQGIVNATMSGSEADKNEAIEYIRALLQLPEDAQDKACPLQDVVGVDTCYNFQTVLDPDYFFENDPITGQLRPQLGLFAKKGSDKKESGVPRPGSPGNSPHKRVIEILKEWAARDFEGWDITIHREENIRSRTGLNVLPDVWVEDNKTRAVLKVYEAVKVDARGRPVLRELVKMDLYNSAGIIVDWMSAGRK
jgi:hypothetical protein